MFSTLTSRTSGNAGQYSSRGYPIRGWIIHHAATTSLGATLGMMSSGSREVSANYVIDVDGEIVGVVPEEYRAWTSASARADGQRLTVEIIDAFVGPNDMTWDTSPEAYAAIARLVADTAARYGFGIDRTSIIGHREVIDVYGEGYPTACQSGISLDKIIQLARTYQTTGAVTPEGGLTVADINTLIDRLTDIRNQFSNMETAPYRALRDTSTGTVYAVNATTGGVYAIPSPAFYNLLVTYKWLSDDLLDVPPNVVEYLKALADCIGQNSTEARKLDTILAKLEQLEGKVAAAPAPAAPATPAPAGEPATRGYTVGRGDTLYKIAGGDAEKVRAILRLNPSLSPTSLVVGSTITIPA